MLPAECHDSVNAHVSSSTNGALRKWDVRPFAQSGAKRPVQSKELVYGIVGGAHGIPKVEISYYDSKESFRPTPGPNADALSAFERGISQAIFQVWYEQVCQPNSWVRCRLGTAVRNGYWAFEERQPGYTWPPEADPQFKRNSTNKNETGFWAPGEYLPCKTYIRGFAELTIAIDEDGVVSIWKRDSDLPGEALDALYSNIVALADHPSFFIPAEVPRKTIKVMKGKEIEEVKACLLRVKVSVQREPGVLVKEGTMPVGSKS